MRPIAVFVLLAGIAAAQFQTTSPLVLAPTTITDSKGQYIDGLTAADLVLYDNNVPQTTQLDFTAAPISLVVAVQTSANSGAVIDKLGRTGILLTQLLAANAGETAVVSFSNEVKIHQPFTDNADLVTHSMRMLRKEGNGADAAHMLDALHEALLMLAERPPARRRIILVIGEKRDRKSHAALSDVAEQVERLNATVYWLTYSPFLEPFTVKPKTMEDLKPEAERIKRQRCALCPAPDDRPAPFDAGPGGYLYAIGELARLHQPDLAELLTKTTGGRTLNFLKKSALEEAIQLVGKEVHRQYLVTFQPAQGEPGQFHSIRVEVKDHPELNAKTRDGYWALR